MEHNDVTSQFGVVSILASFAPIRGKSVEVHDMRGRLIHCDNREFKGVVTTHEGKVVGGAGADHENGGKKKVEKGKEVAGDEQTSQLLGLPDELLEIILLKQDVRTEARCTMVCKQLNDKIWNPLYISARLEESNRHQEFCPVVFPSHRKDCLLGWDIASEKWWKLPGLDFLPPSRSENLLTQCVYGSENGMLFIFNPNLWKSGGRYMTSDLYVCNPMTKSWLYIDISNLLHKQYIEHPDEYQRIFYYDIIIRTKDIGFTLFAATRASSGRLYTVQKLESSNLAIGWLPLKPPSSNLRGNASANSAPTLMDDIIYTVRRYFNPDFDHPHLLLTRYFISEGVWKEQELHLKFNTCRGDTLLKLGGSLWLVQVSKFRPHDDSALSSELLKCPLISIKSETDTILHRIAWRACIIYKYDTKQESFIQVEAAQLGSKIGVVMSGQSTSTICFTKFRSSEIVLLFNVVTCKWSECPDPNVSIYQRQEESHHVGHWGLGSFHFNRAS